MSTPDVTPVPTAPGGFRDRFRSHELTSLEERLGLLFVVRLGLLVVVVLGALFAAGQVGFGITEVGPIAAVYLVIAAGVEIYRRSSGPGSLLLHRIAMPLDAVFLVIVTTPSGGPRSQLVVLFAVQLIAVTLLASERAGIRMALWDSFLFIMIPTLTLSARVGEIIGVKEVAVPPASQTAVAIMGFWVVALCTAFFSNVSERELRRSKAELAALADMASELEVVNGEEEVLVCLLNTVVEAFPFERGALWWAYKDRPAGLFMAAGSQARVATVELGTRPDRVSRDVWASRGALLVRRLDPQEDPVASRLLPGARNVVVLPLRIEGGPSGVVLLEHGGRAIGAKLPKRTLVMLAQFAAHAALALRNARLLAERERLAAIDGLTGIANRREFDKVLGREVSRSERSGEALTLIVLDVDHFKAINDSRGHLAGDEVLREIASVLASAVREMDLVARYGGEEFAVVLPRCDGDDAVIVVRRLYDAVRRCARLDGVTLSAGVASLPRNAADGLSLMAAADEALYDSKRGGRDRFTVSERHVSTNGVRL